MASAGAQGRSSVLPAPSLAAKPLSEVPTPAPDPAREASEIERGAGRVRAMSASMFRRIFGNSDFGPDMHDPGNIL